MKKMKKIYVLMSIVAIVMMLGVSSCKKENLEPTTTPKQYVELMNAKFKVISGVQITTKSYDANPDLVLVDRNWYTFTSNTAFYGTVLHPSTPYYFTLVRGLEFINGSIGWNFWSNPSNNPIVLPANTGVFQNQIPIEPMRITVESRNVGGKVAYIGMRDFEPTTANFPLDIKEYRVGDEVSIDADQLLSMPSGTLTITATYGLSPIDLPATRMQGVMGGDELDFDNIKFGNEVVTTKNVVLGGTTLYSGFEQKVTGSITIKIVEKWKGLDGDHTATINLSPISEKPSGKGMHIKLTTTKLGWFDSGISGISEKDIETELVEVPVN